VRDLVFAGPKIGFRHKGSPVPFGSICASSCRKLLANISIQRK